MASRRALTGGEEDQYHNKTRAYWASRYGRVVSQDESWKITRNTAGFFQVLADWKAAM
jgi:hypothetical protein